MNDPPGLLRANQGLSMSGYQDTYHQFRIHLIEILLVAVKPDFNQPLVIPVLLSDPGVPVLPLVWTLLMSGMGTWD